MSTNEYLSSLTEDLYSNVVTEDIVTLSTDPTNDDPIEFSSDILDYSIDTFDPSTSTVMMHMSPTPITSSKFHDLDDSSSSYTSASASSVSSHSSPNTPPSTNNFSTTIFNDSENDFAQLESTLTQALSDSNYIFSNSKPFFDEPIDMFVANEITQNDFSMEVINMDSLNGIITKDFEVDSLLLDNTLSLDITCKNEFKATMFSNKKNLDITHEFSDVVGASPNDDDSPFDNDKPTAGLRKQSESRIALPELYKRMGLGDNHDEARVREQRILNILRREGFQLGEQTWIRDTTEQERKRIIDTIVNETQPDYGYPRELIEVVVRRGSYYLMQGRLRRIRRGKKAMENKMRKAAAAAASRAL